jgi:alpha-beta hydrolase superfamily lysophospholipase
MLEAIAPMAASSDHENVNDAEPLHLARKVEPPWRELSLELPDGYETAVYLHEPQGPRRLPVVYLHGIQSHPGWFAHSARQLARRGHPVFQVTRRGSGTHARGRGHADSPAQMLSDTRAACEFARRHAEESSVHLAGVSWGGKLAACYAAWEGRGPLTSLTLIAPGLAARVDVPPATKLMIAASLLVAPWRRFDIPLSDPELFTANPRMLAYLREDPHRLHTATAKFLYVSRRLDRLLAKAPPGGIKTPTTLMLAMRDRIIDNSRTEARARRLAGGRLDVARFDAHHTIEFETDTSALVDAMAAALAAAETPNPSLGG